MGGRKFEGKIMAQFVEQGRTGFFTVFGASSIAEEHRDTRSHYHLDTVGRNWAVVAGLWLALYAVIVVLMVVGNSDAVETITTALAY